MHYCNVSGVLCVCLYLVDLLFEGYGDHRDRHVLTHSFPTRRSSDLPPAMVVMEACGSAHYWAREMTKLGHEVKLIAPRYVKPFVKRQKNDAADAEAIVVADQRPEDRQRVG